MAYPDANVDILLGHDGQHEICERLEVQGARHPSPLLVAELENFDGNLVLNRLNWIGIKLYNYIYNIQYTCLLITYVYSIKYVGDENKYAITLFPNEYSSFYLILKKQDLHRHRADLLSTAVVAQV